MAAVTVSSPKGSVRVSVGELSAPLPSTTARCRVTAAPPLAAGAVHAKVHSRSPTVVESEASVDVPRWKKPPPAESTPAADPSSSTTVAAIALKLLRVLATPRRSFNMRTVIS